jgi:hypothetical protein
MKSLDTLKDKLNRASGELDACMKHLGQVNMDAHAQEKARTNAEAALYAVEDALKSVIRVEDDLAVELDVLGMELAMYRGVCAKALGAEAAGTAEDAAKLARLLRECRGA